MTLKDVAEVKIEGLEALDWDNMVEFREPGDRGLISFSVHKDGHIQAHNITPTIPQRIALLQALAKEEDWREEIVEELKELGCELVKNMVNQPVIKYNEHLVMFINPVGHMYERGRMFPCDIEYLPSEVLEVVVKAKKKWEEEQHGA